MGIVHLQIGSISCWARYCGCGWSRRALDRPTLNATRPSSSAEWKIRPSCSAKSLMCSSSSSAPSTLSKRAKFLKILTNPNLSVSLCKIIFQFFFFKLKIENLFNILRYTTCIIWLAFLPIYFGTANTNEVHNFI